MLSPDHILFGDSLRVFQDDSELVLRGKEMVRLHKKRGPPMWDEAKQQRLNELQGQEGMLTEQEKQALEQLLCELEQEGWNALHPALERLRREQEQLQEQGGRLGVESSVLAALAERQEDLLRRAKVELAGLLSEHEALKAEYERLTGQPLRGSLA